MTDRYPQKIREHSKCPYSKAAATGGTGGAYEYLREYGPVGKRRWRVFSTLPEGKGRLMYIGLLGGTFNPIHNGHLHIARYVYSTLPLDQIMFIPTGDPPHKSATSLAPAQHRLEMVKQAIAPFPQFRASDHEIRLGAVSYSVDTVTQFKTESPEETELGFIVGLDAFLDFSSWRKVDHLLTLCHFIVCSRPGVTFTQLQSCWFFPSTPLSELQSLDQQDTTRLDVPLSSGKTIHLLSVPPCEISASTIREHLGRGRPVGHWLPPTVESYIIEHQLYQ